MVRGLIEKKHIVLTQKDFGQFYAHIPALRERLGGPTQFAIPEAQSQQGLSRLNLGWFAVGSCQMLIELREPFCQVQIVLRFIVFAMGQFFRHPAYFLFELVFLIEGGQCLLQYGPSPVVLHNLRKIAHAYVGGHIYLARRRRLKTAYHLHNSGLAGTILTDKSNFIRFADMEVYPVQQDESSIGDCYIIKRNHYNVLSVASSASILAVASACFFLSIATTFSGAWSTKDGLDSFLFTLSRKPL